MWSWGGNALLGDDNVWHGYVSAFLNDCGLSSWTTSSESIHITADSPQGPYSFSDVALPLFHHNTQIIRAPDGTWLIYSIGMSPQSRPENCTHRTAGPRTETGHGAELVQVAYASSPYGPWTILANQTAWPQQPTVLFNGTNPAPWFVPNGTVYVASHNNVGLTISEAAHWGGPYTAPRVVLPYPTSYGYTFEDPCLFFNAPTSTWRALMHMYATNDTRHQFFVGGAAESAGPSIYSEWTMQMPPESGAVFNTTVQFENGTVATFGRRERPKLIMDAAGAPSVLVTGVCPVNSEYCYTLSQGVEMVG